ncbi:glycosyltransferase family protein [Fontisphaera persica]|uniref:glycosyltransferase family protein n=1 Tax=Fontisphaera persica TaxID=2974023 RepID=UPI0024C08C44|nr:glycosyltransferase family protein [Fontisphaera persica]WCJ60814.1 glycosyltransferase family protein [Fontisphaera persica]
MKVVAIIQARMGSTRLPGKVLRTLCGQPVLRHVCNRVRLARRLESLWVATSTRAADDAIAQACAAWNVPCYRGSEDDVLARFHGAAAAAGAEVVVRITADCPLFDGWLLDDMLRVFLEANTPEIRVDYLSNVLERRYPRGLDAEIFTFAALDQAHREAHLPREREHVTPYLYQHPEKFRLHSYRAPEDWSQYRWTLDTPEDWALIEAIYQALYRTEQPFTTRQVLEWLQARPDLAQLNASVRQKE